MKAGEMTVVKVAHIPGAGAFWQFWRYCLVGGVNTFMSVLILNALLLRFPTHNARLLVIENSVAYAGGAVSNFFLNKYWTFGRRHRPTRREGGRFLISVALELPASTGLLWLAGVALSPFLINVTVWGTASKLLAGAVGAVLSYLIMRCWIFASGSSHRRHLRAAISPAASGPTRDAPSPQKMAEPGVKETIAGVGLSVIPQPTTKKR